MADDFKVLAQGTLTNSSATLYTVPGGTQAIIKMIVLANYSGVDRWAKLTVNGAADGNIILPQTTILAGGHGEGGPFTLDAADTLLGYAEANTAITYTVFGMEIT